MTQISEKQALALASATSENEEHPSDSPPLYSPSPADELQISLHTSTSKRPIPGYSHIPLAQYHIPSANVSFDKISQTTYDPALSTSPAALEAFVAEQMKLPPRPTVRIIGRIQGPVPIFNVSCDLFRHVSPNAEKHGVWAYSKVSGMEEVASAAPLRPDEKSALFSGAPDVTGAGFWLRRFCADASPVKKFIFKRQVTNWDTDYLAGQIRQMVHSMGFRGIVDVSFPLQRSTIIVHSPHQVNAVLTSLRNVFVKPKTFEVLTSYWPYASHPRSATDSGLNDKQRECVLQSEEEWWEEWRDAIQLAVAGRRQGWVSVEDKVEAAMSGPGKGWASGPMAPMPIGPMTTGV